MNVSSNNCWPEARTWAEISLGQIAANWRELRRAAAGAEVAAVVKANAYGHGAVEVSRCLESEGCAWFAVSNAAEGAELRRAGIGRRILVMGGFAPFEIDVLFEHQLTPAVHSIADLLALEARAAALGRRLAVHVKLDTGMGRLGTREAAADVARAAASVRHLEVEGVMSHLASAADFRSPQTAVQLQAFEHALAAMRAAGLAPPIAHIGSSAAVCYGMRRAFYQMVRTGLALYGYVPEASGEAPAVQVDVRPALVWKARIVAVKQIPEGEPVGYNARWRAPRPSRVAIAAAGYADGVPHTLAGRGHAIVEGRLVPIVGAVSMDVISVDVTGCSALPPDGVVTLIGREGPVRHDAADFAREAGLIPYVILCGLGRRVVRCYR
ncbi:MAG: alanine racemase [Bryobacteraceae bacterium]